MNDDDELHLGDYLEILRRRWLTIALAVVLVVGAAVALSARTEARYRAEARVSVSTTAAQDRLDPSSGSTNAQTLARRLENELELARSDDVEQAAEAAVGGSFDASVRADSDSDTLVFSATALSADAAAERANAYAAAFVAERTSSTADELDAATATLNARLADIETERDDILEQIDDGADERR
ncbi:MAG: Wzz/FepE/Etk N-terminal domain-containing protein, partial [Acidimicrobiales bacterium]|nr:Wzz/FepE/Etk N-terminal domain-containing protein [Acidimicrobiales bacterium]